MEHKNVNTNQLKDWNLLICGSWESIAMIIFLQAYLNSSIINIITSQEVFILYNFLDVDQGSKQ